MSDNPTQHRGRCLCGAVTFEAEGAPRWVAHCHCQSCRRATGAPITTYVCFANADFRFTGVEPAKFQSSADATRRSCPRCASPISYENANLSDEIHIHISALDNAGAYHPQAHVFCVDALPWLKIDDGLRRHDKFSTGKDSL